MSRRVALVACEDYEPHGVQRAVEQALRLLGGIERFVRQGDRVLVRPNLISPRPIEAAATTHPAVVEAVVRAVQGTGGLVVIGDCPGGNTEAADLGASYEASGLTEVAERTGAELDYDPEPVEVELPQGHCLKRAAVVRAVVQADVVITVPKLKTHSLTGLTGAVKLCFGAVPGRAKTGYHLRYPKVRSFSGALLDLHDLVRPRLTLMDAIMAMEGDGPTAGDPRHVGAILASEDSLACDVAAARLVGLDPLEVSTLQVAVEQGRIDVRLEDLDLVGESLSSLQVRDFRPANTHLLRMPLFNRLVDLLGHWVSPHPAVGEGCIGCGTCAQNCPVQAISILRGEAHIDYDRCIHCFCCQELCPERAMVIHYPRLTRWWAQPR
jgi:uncharacterized protein (DUF362 family)/Pyruvate/2-oxoacid:ferredoxin oxidoreductase delta subunit